MKNVELTNYQRLFLDNAFLFFRHKDRILAESRMYNCEVPFQNGSEFRMIPGYGRATLRTYLEWWQTCDGALILKDDGTEWLMYQILGTPRMRINTCGIVNKEGVTEKLTIDPCPPLCASFIAANCHFYEYDETDDAYMLNTIVDILKEESYELDEKDVHTIFLEKALKNKDTQMNHRIKCLMGTIDCLKEKIMWLKKQDLEIFIEGYKMVKEKIEAHENEIRNRIIELRKQMRVGEIDNIQYQKLLTPLKREREEVKLKTKKLSNIMPKAFFPDYDFSINEIEEFLKQNSHDRN